MPKGSYVPFFAENKKNVLDGEVLKRLEDLPLEHSPALTGTFTVTAEMQFVNEHLRIHVHMLNAETQQEIWSQLIEYKISQSDVFDIQDDVAKKLISAVGDYCRLIKQSVAEPAKMAVA
jgi:TolB-like protein